MQPIAVFLHKLQTILVVLEKRFNGPFENQRNHFTATVAAVAVLLYPQ
jgi:hypothetical protein